MKPFFKHMKKSPLSLAIIGILSVSNLAHAEIVTSGNVTAGAAQNDWVYGSSIVVGGTANGELTALNGSTISSYGASIGQTVGSVGIVNVSGNGSSWNSMDQYSLFLVGEKGTGTVNILDGATVNIWSTFIGYDIGSVGTVNVSGAGTVFNAEDRLHIGDFGSGVMNVTDGAVVNVTRRAGISAGDENSYGELNIVGAGSTFNASNPFTVSWSGVGQLNIRDGGQLNTNGGRIGMYSDGVGNAVLSGTDSHWNSGSSIIVGYAGKGSLTVGNNAQLSALDVIVSLEDGSTGYVNIGAEVGASAVAAGHINADKITLGSKNATLSFNHTDTDYEFAPLITGSGNVNFYSGTTTFTTENNYTGDTTLFGGVLKAGKANVLNTQSNYIVNTGGKIDLNNYDQTLASLENGGAVDFSGAGNTTLTISGNYVGTGGQINMNGILAGDTSVTDKLVIQGNSSGTSYVSVNNMGGSGAQTIDGIELIQVSGSSDGEFIQNGRIVAGAYDYSLVRGTGAGAANWYLTSSAAAPSELTDSASSSSQQRPEAGSYGVNLAAANTMFVTRLHDRLGETQYIDALTGEKKVTSMWLRNEGGHTRSHDTSGQLHTQSNRYVVQMGGDIAQWGDGDQSRLHLGVMAGYANNKGTTRSRLSGYSSQATVDGYSTGLYATWYANDADKSGLYVDGWAQYSWFNNSVNGQELQREEYKSKGATASLESGYTFKLGEDVAKNTSFYIQPKAQVVWMGVKADDHKESNGTNVTGEGNNNIQTRLGARLFINGYSEIDKGKDRVFQPFIEANWIHNTKDFAVSLDDVSVKQDGTANIAELKLGLEAQINKKTNLWGNVAHQFGYNGYSDTAVMFGAKVNF